MTAGRHPLDRRHTRTPSSAGELEQVLHDKIAACPEDLSGILWWALTVTSGMQALGLTTVDRPAPAPSIAGSSGPIEPVIEDTPRRPPFRLRLVKFDDPRRLPPGYRRRVLALVKVLLLARGEEADREARADFFRADGNCVCETCGLAYWQHPQDPFEPWLEVLCDGSRVKL